MSKEYSDVYKKFRNKDLLPSEDDLLEIISDYAKLLEQLGRNRKAESIWTVYDKAENYGYSDLIKETK